MSETDAPAPAPKTIGERLRAGRERAGLSVAAAAEKLHLDPKIIESLEADRFAELGASVYVRGHLRRYGDFVGEPGAEMVDAYSAREASPPPPDLTQVPHAERRSDPRRLISPLVGLGCALVLATAIWWVLAGSRMAALKSGGAAMATDVASGTDASGASDVSADSAGDGAAAPPPAPAAASSAREPAASRPAAPTSRSEGSPASRPQDSTARDPAAEVTPAPPPARPTVLRLQLSSESWIEVYDSQGERLFYDVASAGSVQSFEGRPPLRVVLGNAAAVSVQVNGEARSIPSNAVDGDSARFVVNRSGSLSRSR